MLLFWGGGGIGYLYLLYLAFIDDESDALEAESVQHTESESTDHVPVALPVQNPVSSKTGAQPKSPRVLKDCRSYSPPLTVFVSWRMGECKDEVKEQLQPVLEARGVTVIVVGELAGGDLLQAVTDGMEKADVYVVMGTETYGKRTSGSIDTYQEMQYIVSSRKPYFLFNMNPDDSLMRFKEAPANMIFNLNNISWERWRVGDPMPSKAADNIVEKLQEARDGAEVAGAGGGGVF